MIRVRVASNAGVEIMVSSESVCTANPVHPGGFVKAEIIAPLALSVTQAARSLGITRAALSAFLNGHAALSPDMAIRIEKAFGVSMETLMRMQNNFDIAQARKREALIPVARYVPSATAPQPKMLDDLSIIEGRGNGC